ncbi:hypothetical protein PV325_004639, partial [Microctonus aethiopoides]
MMITFHLKRECEILSKEDLDIASNASTDASNEIKNSTIAEDLMNNIIDMSTAITTPKTSLKPFHSATAVATVVANTSWMTSLFSPPNAHNDSSEKIVFDSSSELNEVDSEALLRRANKYATAS